jgi:hypothetical protein
MGHGNKVLCAVASILLNSQCFLFPAFQRPALHRPIVGMGFQMVLPTGATEEKENRLSRTEPYHLFPPNHDVYSIGIS